VRKASIKDKEIVSEILVSAFAPLMEENSINLVVKQDHRRVERIRILMEYLFERALSFGEVYLSENHQACLLLSFPHKERITIKTIAWNIKLAVKCIGMERIFGVLKRQRIAKGNCPKEKHIRPLIMGVKKEFKGNGTAARLMLEVKNLYEDNKLPVIIDAASEANAKLYQKFGFKIFKEEKTLGFPIYFLRLN